GDYRALRDSIDAVKAAFEGIKTGDREAVVEANKRVALLEGEVAKLKEQLAATGTGASPEVVAELQGRIDLLTAQLEKFEQGDVSGHQTVKDAQFEVQRLKSELAATKEELRKQSA